MDMNGNYQPPPGQPQVNPEAGAGIAREANNLYHTIVAIMSIKAGQNHYAVTGDMGRATAAGAGIFVRLNIWAYTFFMWWLFFIGTHDQVMRGLLILVAPFAFGVTWVRNSDYALYNRRWFYRFWSPIATMPWVEKIPTTAIYAVTWLLIVGAWFS
jgi:hypothetical protein